MTPAAEDMQVANVIARETVVFIDVSLFSFGAASAPARHCTHFKTPWDLAAADEVWTEAN